MPADHRWRGAHRGRMVTIAYQQLVGDVRNGEWLPLTIPTFIEDGPDELLVTDFSFAVRKDSNVPWSDVLEWVMGQFLRQAPPEQVQIKPLRQRIPRPPSGHPIEVEPRAQHIPRPRSNGETP